MSKKSKSKNIPAVISAENLKLFQRHPGGRSRIFEEPEEIEGEFSNYLDYCSESQDVPCILGFCLFAGIGRATFYEYEKQDKFIDSVKKIRDTLEYIIEQCTYKERANPTKWIFMGKVRFNWSDQPAKEKDSNKELPVVITRIIEYKDTKAIETNTSE